MSNNKLIAKNTLLLGIRTLVSLLISFYTTRVILHSLGVIDYGLFNIIYGVVAFFVFIVSSFNDSVQRFLSIALGQRNESKVKNTFKCSMLIYLISGLIFCSFLVIVKNLVVYHALKIPSGSIPVANCLYYISVIAILITIIQTPFNALVVAHEKMSFFAYMSIFDALSKLAVSYLVVVFTGNKVLIYATLLLTSSVFVLSIYIGYCYKKFKYTFFGGHISSGMIKEISYFSFWNVFGNFAYVCRTQGINVLVNIFFGVAVNAAYAISISILNATNAFVQAFITAIRPQIYKSYGEGEFKRFESLIQIGSKYTFAILFCLCCPVIICTEEILNLWLVNVPAYTIYFVRGFLVVALIDSFSNCVMTGIQSTGKIKNYQIIVGITITLTLPLTYLTFLMIPRPESLFYPLLIISLICLPLRIFFINKLANINVKSYIKNVIKPCLIYAVLSFSLNLSILNFFDIKNIFILFLYIMVNVVITLSILYTVVVSVTEKKIILNSVLRKFR